MEAPAASSEIEELKRQIELAQKDLERLEQMKPLAQLASTVVHDVRNSLGVISSTSQFVLTHLKPADKEKQAWEMVVRNVETIRGILKSYLGFAKQFETERELASPDQILDRISHFVELQAKKQNTRIEKALSGSGTRLMLDVAAIESSLLNIALNALEAVEHDGAVKFSSGLSEDRKWFLIEISDTGPGVAAETREKLFQPFFTTKKSGTGMGLYSAKIAVQNHGGSLQFDSRPGKGTRMIFCLPLPQDKA